jgi:formylglycine-generating enzyme required for sulfatase activity
MRRRVEFAETIEERSRSGEEAGRRWEEAIEAIAASPAYGGLTLAPQLGLLPLGVDPDSGLWEFAHLQTGEPAVRGADGKLVLIEATGLVLVLIPGGTFWMGAQKWDPAGHNHDPGAQGNEGPPHEVTLSPYFLSKYEMTQGQWERFVGRNPSNYGPQNYDSSLWNRERRGWSALHPVEQVGWPDCMLVMERLGLSLPSEAQWEAGARGGASSVYWTGNDAASLLGAANLSDEYGKRNGNAPWLVWERNFDDGNSVHAVVGSYRANGFGLHDLHGNVWEWCLDGYDSNAYSPDRPRDPVVPWTGSASRVGRGGSFYGTASDARSAARYNATPEYRNSTLGLRPAKGVEP